MLDYRHIRHEILGAYILVAHAPVFTCPSSTTKAVPSASATTSSPSAYTTLTICILTLDIIFCIHLKCNELFLTQKELLMACHRIKRYK
jgi:hypothetical protein